MYDDAEDITHLVHASRIRLRRLYGQDMELAPPLWRAPFHLFPTAEEEAFLRAHQPPPMRFGNVSVLRQVFLPVSYFVDPECACDWCVGIRKRGIPAVANQVRA